MVALDLDGDATGLSGIIMADQSGAEIPFTYYDAEIVNDIYGCTDMEACNYDMDATMDDGSCDYGTMCEDGSYECDANDCETGGDWDGDACTMPDYSLHVASDGSVLYNSSSPIAGFQFNVDGASVLSASGGDAEAQGFMISSSAETVLGFSLSGATFSGCGTMIELELDGDASGLSGIIISDSAGEALPFEYFDGSGGTDPYCGDGECNAGEDYMSCPEDCDEPEECTDDVCLSFANSSEGEDPFFPPS